MHRAFQAEKQYVQNPIVESEHDQPGTTVIMSDEH
jgi:hypothetical protein